MRTKDEKSRIGPVAVYFRRNGQYEPLATYPSKRLGAGHWLKSGLIGKLILPFLGEAACHCVVQRHWPVEIIRDQAERGSGIGLKLFGFIPDSVFTIIPESCSGSPRNSVRNHLGIAFTLDRIPKPRGTWVRLDRPGR
jgi:hypothetical protein